MNTCRLRRPTLTRTRFPEPEDVEPPGREAENLALAELKDRLLREALTHDSGEPLARLVRLAAVEAEAQAWLTSFPLLFFPELFEEKTRTAQSYVARQKSLRR